MYCPGCRSKTFATKSSRPLCLRSISSLRRFLLTKAISMPEKKAERSSITRIRITDTVIATLRFAVRSSAAKGPQGQDRRYRESSLRSGFHRGRQPPIRQKLKLLFLQAVSRKKQPTRFFRILKRLAAHPISKFFNYIHCSFFHSFKFIFLSYRPDADGYGSAPLQANGHSLL